MYAECMLIMKRVKVLSCIYLLFDFNALFTITYNLMSE